MPHKPRLFLADTSVHVIHRGNNRTQIFGDVNDYECFLALLKAATRRHGLSVHAFALMTTHYHLMVTPRDETSLPRSMKEIGVRYVRYFNRKYERVGTLWCGRYRGILIEDDSYALTCLRYIEQNAVEAGMVPTPDDYGWSSYRALVSEQSSPWLVPHPVYLGLAATSKLRQAAYRALCGVSLSASERAKHLLDVASAP